MGRDVREEGSLLIVEGITEEEKLLLGKLEGLTSGRRKQCLKR